MSTIHFGQETIELTLTSVNKAGTTSSIQDAHVLGNPKEARCVLQKNLLSLISQRSAKLTTELLDSISAERLEEVAEWCKQIAIDANTDIPKLAGRSYKYAKNLQQFIKVTKKSLDEILKATVFETSFGHLLSIEYKETEEEVFNTLVSLTPQAYAPVTAVSTKPVAKVEPVVKLTAAPVAVAPAVVVPAAVAPATTAPAKRIHPSLLRAQARQWAKEQFGR